MKDTASTTSSDEFTTISFDIDVDRVVDSHGFVYGSTESELVGSNRDFEILRTVRLGHICRKESAANCDQTNFDRQILLIEESVRVSPRKGILGLVGRFTGLDLNFNEDEFTRYLRAQSNTALSTYTTSKNGKGCRRGRACEMSLNIFVCSDRAESAL